jgi:transmembrane 9 superfamily protein 2/4
MYFLFVPSSLCAECQAYQLPGTVTLIPRPIQVQKWYLNKVLTVLVGALLPFGAVFIELFFIFSSIWLNRYALSLSIELFL